MIEEEKAYLELLREVNAETSNPNEKSSSTSKKCALRSSF